MLELGMGKWSGGINKKEKNKERKKKETKDVIIEKAILTWLVLKTK